MRIGPLEAALPQPSPYQAPLTPVSPQNTDRLAQPKLMGESHEAGTLTNTCTSQWSRLSATSNKPFSSIVTSTLHIHLSCCPLVLAGAFVHHHRLPTGCPSVGRMRGGVHERVAS
jgi:hypothetical protein